MQNERVRQARELAERQGLDALAIVPGPNMLHLSGISLHLSERPSVLLIPVDDEPAMVLPEFEAAKARSLGLRAFAYSDEEGYALAFHEASVALELADARVGVEDLRMRVLEAGILERYAPGVTLVPVNDLFAGLRLCKTQEELTLMRSAIAIAEKAFLDWLEDLHVGMTEREAAALLVAALLRGGADTLAFEPIVAGGPNGALPHAVPSDRAFAAGDWVVVDWGAAVSGYDSDLTRVVVFGQAQEPLATVCDLVIAANRAGRMAVRPGIEAQAVDAATRAVITDGGYGPQFTHRTGHGLGRESHEPPYIVAGNPQRLEPGMVFTVEPGIYLEGTGGVRGG